MIALTAVLLASIAALFSVTGMGRIFVGWPILIMASAIEIGKLMAVSVLYRLWDSLKWWRVVLIPMTLIIMVLTSAGIYGYLSSAYESTAAGSRTQTAQIELESKKKGSLEERIAFYEKSIDRKQERATSLSNLRSQQENRLDSLYARNQIRTAKGVQASIAEADKEINKLNTEADSINALIGDIREQMSAVDSSVVTMESESAQGEMGALKYISRTTGMPMDSVANLFMLMIICVFDPLAIIFVIVFNMAWDKATREDDPVVAEAMPKIEPPALEPEVPKIDTPTLEPEVRPEVHEPEIKEPEMKAEPSKTEQVVYETNSEGDFVRTDDDDKQQLLLKGPRSKFDLYSSLLYVLYQNGRLNENDDLGDYKQILESVRNSNIICTGEQLDEFLKRCVHLKLIKIGKKDTRRVALKKYADALEALRIDIGETE